MVGGKIDSALYLEDKVVVTVVDGGDVCSIDLRLTEHDLRPGDGIWWQSRMAYWTPKDRSREDVAIPRIGYSHHVKND